MSGPVAVDAGPFDLRPVSAQDASAVLCLHGLTGTPYEVRPLGEALCARGFRAQGVLLPGHGASVEMLARLEHGAWVDAVRAAYRRLADEHARVHVLGMSLGGLLALNLAADEPVASVVSIGAPLKFAWPLPLLIGLLKRIKPMLEKKTGSDIRDPIARARHPGYRHMPLASVHALIRLQAEVDAKLGRIDAPAFVGHGALDETARPVDADSIYAALGSTHKRIEIYADSGHVVPVDHDGAALAQAVAEFVAEVD